MKILILGSTGLLGQALSKKGKALGYEIKGIARNNADICLDITDISALEKTILDFKPDVIINTVAIVNLIKCEENPGLAYLVNARPSAFLSSISQKIDAYYIYISTDHYFTGDKDKKHDENAKITLLNEYARTKFAGEKFTMLNPASLVLRTNIVGFRGQKEQLTFVEWLIHSLKNKLPMTLFNDYFTSSIDVKSFSGALFDLISKNKRPAGMFNLACREIVSKKQFIEKLAKELGFELLHSKIGSVFEAESKVLRAESIGLDVSKIENVLEYKLPDFEEVISNIVTEYEEYL